jgi:hypothetical protein
MRSPKTERLFERRADAAGFKSLTLASSARSGRSFTREFGRERRIVYAWSFSAMCVSIG